MLIDEQDVVFEAGIEVGLQPELTDNWVVVAVDVSIDTVHSLEDLTNHAWERLGEVDTYSARENHFIVDRALNPAHEMLDVCRGRHLGRALEFVIVLP